MASGTLKKNQNPIEECRALLEEVAQAIKARKTKRARDLLKKAATLPQNEPQLNFLIGVFFARIQENKKAIDAFKKAIEVRHACHEYYSALGTVLLKEKKLKEASQNLKKATFLDPTKVSPWLNLALSSYSLQRPGEGRRALLKFLWRFFLLPVQKLFWFLIGLFAGGFGFLAGLFNRQIGVRNGMDLFRAKIFIFRNHREKAFQILRGAYSRDPDCLKVSVFLARQFQFFENGNAAKEILEKILEKNPQNPLVISFLAEILSLQGRIREAFSLLKRVPKEKRNFPFYLKALGLAFYRNNEAENSLEFFEKAAKRAKKPADLYNTYARALGSLGRLDEAEEKFRLAIKADKTFPHAYTGLAKMGKLPPNEPLFKHLLKEIKNPNLPQKTRCFLNFSAGFAYEKAEQYDLAFKHFRNANNLRDVSFSKTAWAQKGKDLREVFKAGFLAQSKKFGHPSKTPIFIVGMPRSGTTLTQQILAAHSEVYGAGEREAINIIIQDFQKGFREGPNWPFSIKNLKKGKIRDLAEKYLAEYQKVAPKAEKATDKMPNNFWELGFISMLFPEAKIIHCTRDPLDTCLSNYFQAYLTFHPYAFRLDTLGFYFKEYQKIMAHWHKVLPGKIFDFNYEETITDPKPQIQKLLKFCDLEWEDSCLNFHQTKAAVQTASFAQVRQPIYKTSANKWHLYEAYLDPLKEALQ